MSSIVSQRTQTTPWAICIARLQSNPNLTTPTWIVIWSHLVRTVSLFLTDSHLESGNAMSGPPLIDVIDRRGTPRMWTGEVTVLSVSRNARMTHSTFVINRAVASGRERERIPVVSFFQNATRIKILLFFFYLYIPWIGYTLSSILTSKFKNNSLLCFM